MAFSVNTSAGVFLALQSLNKTNRELYTIQSRINTGYKVGSARDNGAVFAIAQTLRADVSGLNAVQSSLDRGISTLDIAVAAGEAISDLLIELKEKAVAAKDSGLDTASRNSLNNDFSQLRDQITSIIESAEFNNKNLVKSGATGLSAITNPNGSKTIEVSAQDLSLNGSNISITASTSISTSALASTAVDLITASLSKVISALSSLGAGSKRLDLQKTFITKLSDTIQIGVGRLVDADLAKESANLQAHQVKLQLGLQALSIANNAPLTILSLFT